MASRHLELRNDEDDDEAARLVLENQVEDLEQLVHNNRGLEKRREGDTDNLDFAVRLHRAELEEASKAASSSQTAI